MNTPFVLCYAEPNWAWFTTQKLSDQWGDDWDDSPYEHNAGHPNEYQDYHKEDGIEPWQILKVAWDGDFELPCSGHHNSPFSVQQINAGTIAWLRSPSWASTPVAIPAGTNLERFKELIKQGNGNVYVKD